MNNRDVHKFEVVDANGRSITVECYEYDLKGAWHEFWTTSGTRVAFLRPLEVRKLNGDTGTQAPTP